MAKEWTYFGGVRPIVLRNLNIVTWLFVVSIDYFCLFIWRAHQGLAVVPCYSTSQNLRVILQWFPIDFHDLAHKVLFSSLSVCDRYKLFYARAFAQRCIIDRCLRNLTNGLNDVMLRLPVRNVLELIIYSSSLNLSQHCVIVAGWLYMYRWPSIQCSEWRKFVN